MGSAWVSALRSHPMPVWWAGLTKTGLSCGKTTLARLIAKRTNANFKELSATAVGVNDIRPIFDEAKGNLQLTGRWVDYNGPHMAVGL
jgi:hypothetical protein